ncbi:calcium-binding protein, partial [Maricaulis sp.]|uniref:calcium-binding protein n=2 Tax=Maricaulis sp. TaxID=1486257 RepID=UPI003A9449BA
MSFTTAQDFIDAWTELDAAYVTFPSLSSVGGNYQDNTPVATAGEFVNVLSEFPDYFATLQSGATTMGQLALAVNKLFVELANAYVEYLDAGNPPILDIAKDRGGAPAPGQTFHDNILGNLGDSPIASRFGSVDPADNVDVTGDGIGDLVAEPRSTLGQTYGDRPYYDGASGHKAAHIAAVVWDIEHGININGGQLEDYRQGFESGSDGWFDGSNGWAGSVSVVASGTNGIQSADGSQHAIFQQDGSGAPFARLGAYRSDFGDGYSTQIKIYLDTGMATGEGFDFSVAANDQSGNHLQDFIFHVAMDTSTGQMLVGADNNSNFDPREDLDTLPNHGTVTESGWYTFEHTFFDAGDGTLAVAMTVYDEAGDAIFTEVRNTESNIIDSNVGGNRYAWFTNIDVTGGIAVDSQSLSVTTETVTVSSDHTLGAETLNLTLSDAASNTEDFEDFDLGAITDGENDWAVAGATDQEIILDGSDQALRISSDPSQGHFGGPYAPQLAVSAGESSTTAGADSMQMTFKVKAFAPGDNSRLELDFGNAAGTDRVNFMVLENTAGGLRIATSEPMADGVNWETGDVDNDFTAFTGNRTIVEGLDNTREYEISLILRFVDGSDNDVIDIYVDGEWVGSTTTFENYTEFHLGQDHDTAQEANQAATVFFRGSASGAPNDGAGGENQGFVIDDISYSTFNTGDGANGTGNALDNTIRGNSANNVLDGAAGDDILVAGIGNDTLIGGAGADTLYGDIGVDTADYSASDAGIDVRLWRGGDNSGGHAEGDRLRDIENLTGSAFD